MSNYKQQEFDFVTRTKKILEQYDNIDFPSNGKEKYEVTLLLNCFVGLLILPKEHWYDKLPTTGEIDENEWGINPAHITIIDGGVKSVQKVVEHLRNSVAHYRFTLIGDENGEIESIEFKDCRSKKPTLEAKIPIKNIKLFLEKFSDWFLKEMGNTKQRIL